MEGRFNNSIECCFTEKYRFRCWERKYWELYL